MTAPAATTPDEKPAELDSTSSLLTRLNELFPRIETPDGHYTAPEVSRRNGVSKNAIIGSMGGENWVQRGLKVSPVTPRDPQMGEVLRYYFREADVEAFVARMHAEGRWRKRGPGIAHPTRPKGNSPS